MMAIVLQLLSVKKHIYEFQIGSYQFSFSFEYLPSSSGSDVLVPADTQNIALRCSRLLSLDGAFLSLPLVQGVANLAATEWKLSRFYLD